jgi:quercetin dioxygenase-like cupin family protein
MSSDLSTSAVVTAVAPEGVRPVEGTPGIERLLALDSERAMLIRARGGPRIESGWHHHGRREVFGHVLRGRVRFEYGPGGRGSTEVEEGGYFHVPVGLVHRDVNPDDQPQDMVIVFVGDGPLVVNLDGPDP